MSSGLENSHVIDVIAEDPASGEVALIMHETRPWTGSDEQIFQLQEKANTYVSFALDGEMAESFPQYAGRKLRLQLDCVTPPDEKTLTFLTLIRDQVALQDINFIVNVRGSSPGH